MTLEELEADLRPSTVAQLRAARIRPGRPVIAVDVDEVLVRFVGHLGEWMQTIGLEMRLKTYQLEGSMFVAGTDDALPFEECIATINRFFEAQARHQTAVPGGSEALSALAGRAQVVVLTNVPEHATEDRRANLAALGIPCPLIVNSGGKGRALAWLKASAEAPVALIDDSVKQLESGRKWVPDAFTIHFAWEPLIDRLFPDCEFASARARGWNEARHALIEGFLGPDRS